MTAQTGQSQSQRFSEMSNIQFFLLTHLPKVKSSTTKEKHHEHDKTYFS